MPFLLLNGISVGIHVLSCGKLVLLTCIFCRHFPSHTPSFCLFY